MKLVREVYWWWKDNEDNCQYWFVVQDLHTWYAPYLERPQFSDL